MNLWTVCLTGEKLYLQVLQLPVINKIDFCYVLQARLVFYVAGYWNKTKKRKKRERESCNLKTYNLLWSSTFCCVELYKKCRETIWKRNKYTNTNTKTNNETEELITICVYHLTNSSWMEEVEQKLLIKLIEHFLIRAALSQ